MVRRVGIEPLLRTGFKTVMRLEFPGHLLWIQDRGVPLPEICVPAGPGVRMRRRREYLGYGKERKHGGARGGNGPRKRTVSVRAAPSVWQRAVSRERVVCNQPSPIYDFPHRKSWRVASPPDSGPTFWRGPPPKPGAKNRLLGLQMARGAIGSVRGFAVNASCAYGGKSPRVHSVATGCVSELAHHNPWWFCDFSVVPPFLPPIFAPDF